jgi:hypothetical protein
VGFPKISRVTHAIFFSFFATGLDWHFYLWTLLKMEKKTSSGRKIVTRFKREERTVALE